MYIIAGLGNPTYQYIGTRHNIGFEVIDELAKKNQIGMDREKFKGICGTGVIAGKKVLLLQPMTYMNLSGESIQQVVDYYKIDPKEELIVIYDDISLDVGCLRIREKGSAGGHNGVKSIIACLGMDTFKRIRIGIGDKPKGWNLADYVLGHFSEEERHLKDKGVEHATQALEYMLTEGIQATMSCFNKKGPLDD